MDAALMSLCLVATAILIDFLKVGPFLYWVWNNLQKYLSFT